MGKQCIKCETVLPENTHHLQKYCSSCKEEKKKNKNVVQAQDEQVIQSLSEQQHQMTQAQSKISEESGEITKIQVLLVNLSEKFEKLVSTLEEVVKLLPEKQKVVDEKSQAQQYISLPVGQITDQQASQPIPFEYRQLADNVLNRMFEVEVFPRSDLPAFEFVISVPRKYSNATPVHWDIYKADKRPKMITYADGLLGVRDWCEKVFNNFNQDTRTMIVTDRVNGL